MKLQTNFAWQKYEGDPENQKNEFQYQLQNQHVQVSNAVNSTIDDDSFFLRERQTAFTWVAGAPRNAIWKVTVPTATWSAGPPFNNVITLPITGSFTVIFMFGTISNGTTTINLPHVDSTAVGNGVSIVRTGTTVTLTTQNAATTAFSGFVTVYYTKP